MVINGDRSILGSLSNMAQVVDFSRYTIFWDGCWDGKEGGMRSGAVEPLDAPYRPTEYFGNWRMEINHRVVQEGAMLKNKTGISSSRFISNTFWRRMSRKVLPDNLPRMSAGPTIRVLQSHTTIWPCSHHQFPCILYMNDWYQTYNANYVYCPYIGQIKGLINPLKTS